VSVEQDIGHLQAQVIALKDELKEAKDWLKEISDKQSATNTMIAEAFASGRGTWKTLAFLGSIATVLGGAAGWFLNHTKAFQ
jgi:hypothetical protein